MTRITLKTIAKEAGVSIATVSMALRGQGKLAPDTVERIRQIADKLGYTPDPMLASLASRRFRSGKATQGLSIALLEFSPFKSEQKAPVHQYRKFLTDYAKGLGYVPTVYPLEEMRRYQDFTRLLYHRGTVGAVITGQPQTDLFDNHKHWNHLCLTQCGRYQSTLPLHSVRPNIFQAIQLAFTKAYDKGYRKIGFAIGQHTEILEDDLARFGAAMSFIHTKLPAKNRINPFFGYLDDDESIIEWFNKHSPDVVVGFSSNLWYKLQDAGISIPKDTGYIALHMQPNQSNSGKIAGLNQSKRQIAEQSILLIDQMVRHNERGIPDAPRDILIHSSWVEGSSLPPSGA